MPSRAVVDNRFSAVINILQVPGVSRATSRTHYPQQSFGTRGKCDYLLRWAGQHTALHRLGHGGQRNETTSSTELHWFSQGFARSGRGDDASSTSQKHRGTHRGRFRAEYGKHCRNFIQCVMKKLCCEEYDS
ncbi:unnamed protein product [Amoebophrya sp. A25]|nr:unnamed protein product [Amoebophrya sp. A25]CAD7976058.1 unnamed protein product [Amoebophrya sp. A25]|eukprot:GSA25T00026982001.1